MLRVGAFRFVVYSNDHGPPHVHVWHGRGEVKIELGAQTEEPRIVRVDELSMRIARVAKKLAAKHRTELLAAWKRIHTDD